MCVVGGAKQQCGGIDGGAGRYNDVRRVFLACAVAPRDNFCDHSSAGVGFKPLNVSIGQQRNVRIFERRLHADGLSIGLTLDQAGKAVTGAAANALARVWVFFVDQDAKRDGKRIAAELGETVYNVLHTLLMTYRGPEVGFACPRFRGIAAPLAMDLIQILSLAALRFK